MALSIALLLLFGLHSCGSRPYPRAIQVADSIVSAYPDSAIALLRSLEDSIAREPRSTQMYYWLLTVKAQDKAYIPHTSDSLIGEVLRYYQHEGDRKHLPEAYYYAASVYRDLGDAPQALDYFIEAEKAVDKEHDYDLAGRICSQIGTLYLYQDVYDKALPVFQKAYQYKIVARDSTRLVYTLRDIGRTYSVLNQVDSALYYYRKADTLAVVLQNDYLRRMVNGELSAYYTQLQMYEEAHQSLEIAFHGLHYRNMAPRYSAAARYYFHTNQIDSAFYYYHQLTQIEGYSYKEEGFWGLANIARLRGSYQEAFSFFDRYLLYADSVKNEVQAEAVRKINALYNYQLREEENIQLQMQNKRQQMQLVVVVVIAVAMLASFAAYRQNRKRKEEATLNQLRRLKDMQEQKYRQSQAYIKENQERIGLLEKELQEAKQSQDQLQQDLIEAKKQALEKDNEQIEARIKVEAEAVKALKASDIYRKFHLASEDNRINADDWQALVDAVNHTYNDFTYRLMTLHPLTEVELHVCLLIKTEIPFGQIVQIVHRSKQGVSSIRKRLYRKVFNKEGTPEDWDCFIRDF